jgi:dienelactone hydrolase
VALVSLTALSPFASHARPVDQLPEDEVARRVMELQHLPWDGRAVERIEDRQGDCIVSRVTIDVFDPVRMASKPLALKVVRPDLKVPVPAVIVVPTIEGVTIVENKVASQLCAGKMAAIVADVHDNSMPASLPAWGIEDIRTRQSILAIRTAIDFAKEMPYFDSERVGIIGMSLGGIVTSFIAGIESDRLAATYIVVGGGDIPYILATSDNERVTELRNKRMKSEKLSSPSDYEERLHQTVRYDPMHFAGRARAGKMHMVLSSADSKVPSLVQREMHRAFGSPTSEVYSVGHVATIVSLTYVYFNSALHFFQDHFRLPRTEAASDLENAPLPKELKENPEILAPRIF